MCGVCGNFKPHDYTHYVSTGKIDNLMFACSICRTSRVFGNVDKTGGAGLFLAEDESPAAQRYPYLI